MTTFNIIFAGTPDFAAVSLNALIHSDHHIKAVYTQPDRPAGRGRHLTASPVKELALKHQLPIYQPLSLKDKEEQQRLANLSADVMIVVAYGLLLPKPILDAPKLGCINVHASLLPRWRGAAPIQRSILAGDAQTGITIMQMNEGLDTGPMLYKVECAISANDTSATLHDKLAELGATALLETLSRLTEIKAEKQNEASATYAQKIKKEEALLDWHHSAVELERKIRAFNPWPVAFIQNNIRIWEAKAIEKEIGDVQPGTILQASAVGIDVATGKGILRLLKLQLPGGKTLAVADILNSRKEEFAPGKIV